MPFFPQFSNLFVAPYIPPAPSPSINPDDVSGLVLWLKADFGVTQAGGIVSAWADQSAGGLDATASGSPSYLSNAINGLPAIEFDGTSYMTGGGPLSGSSASMLVVCKHDTYQSVGMVFEQHDGSSDSMAFYRGFASGGNNQRKTRIYNGIDLDGTLVSNDDTFYIFSCKVNDSTANLYLNGDSDSSGYAGDLTAVGDYYIARWEGGNQNTICTIAEVIIYDNVISENDRTGVEAYLNNKYAIY